MRSAVALRQQIESSLAARIPAALSVRFRHTPELIPTGIAEIDTLLSGGLPLGGLTEITGPPVPAEARSYPPFWPVPHARDRHARMWM